MKIAAVTNNGTVITPHFGKATGFVVLTIEDGKIVHRETRDKDRCSHSEHHDAANEGQNVQLLDASAPAPVDSHTSFLQIIADCDAVLSRGMGTGMYNALQRSGVRPVLTKIALIDAAVTAYLDGSLDEHPELVH